MTLKTARLRRSLLIAPLLWALGACEGEEFVVDSSDDAYPVERTRTGTMPGKPGKASDRESLLGGVGLDLFGKDEDDQKEGGTIYVNSYLWRASLDTISFLPISSADPFGGVIITDWYKPPVAPNERFKVTVWIRSGQLRTDGVRASVFRQQRDPAGGWLDVPVEPRTAIDLENTILARARQLRITAAQP